MATPTQTLLGGSFAEWLEAVKTLDLDSLDEAGFLGMLRPYYWYVHQPGFQDVADASDAAYQILEARKADLDDGYNFDGLRVFLLGYLAAQALDTRGWIFMGGSAEIAACTSAGALAEKLTELQAPAAEIAALKAIEVTMKRMEGAKHMAGNNIREIGAKHLDTLNGLIDTLHPGSQDFILHAMDGSTGDPGVIAFYQGFLERNLDTTLKESVEEYLASVR